jgi:hypothetical protein
VDNKTEHTNIENNTFTTHNDRMNSSTATDPDHKKPSHFCKNLNIYWLAATGVAVWFLFVHAPPILAKRPLLSDPLFYIHLLGAYGVYLACIHNSLVTPSIHKLAHVAVGRSGMVLGAISFVFGAYITWTRVATSDLGFSISITIGGILQVTNQYWGMKGIWRYRQLKEEIASLTLIEESNNNDEIKLEELMNERDKALNIHKKAMLGVFVMGCGIPAAIRMLEKAQMTGILPIFLVIGSFQLLLALYGRHMTQPTAKIPAQQRLLS